MSDIINKLYLSFQCTSDIYYVIGWNATKQIMITRIIGVNQLDLLLSNPFYAACDNFLYLSLIVILNLCTYIHLFFNVHILLNDQRHCKSLYIFFKCLSLLISYFFQIKKKVDFVSLSKICFQSTLFLNLKRSISRKVS